MFYSSTTSMWFSIFTIGSCIVLFSRDVVGQQTLPLHSTLDRDICQGSASRSFVANENRLIIQGDLDVNLKNNPDEWPVYLSVQSTADKSTFQAFCTVDAVGEGCRDRHTDGCYCKSEVSSTYSIVVNQTLPQSLNGSYLRVRWNRENFTAFEEFYTSKLTVYPPTMQVLTSTLDNKKVFECTLLPDIVCQVELIENMTYPVKLSTNGLENPTLNITFDGKTESYTSTNNLINFNTKFDTAGRTVQADFKVKEGGGCGSTRMSTVAFNIISDSPDNVKSSWSIVWIPFVAVLVGAGNTGTSVYGGKRGWFSGLKRKSGEADVSEADKEIRLPPISSPPPAPPASTNGTKPKPTTTTTTTSDEDRTKKKRKKNKVMGGESEKKSPEKETPEKKNPEKKQRKTKKAGESDEGAEQTDQVRPLPSPRMVGEPGFNTSSTSPVNLRSNFSASLAHQGIKSDTRPPSIEVTTRALPKPKKK